MCPRSKKSKQITVNMQTDMTLREKATRLCALIGVCSLGIYLAACNYGELPVDGEGTGKVELRFSASISDSPSTKGTIAQPAITQGNAFEEGMDHPFGLFVTRSDGDALTTGSDDNMKSILRRTGDSQTWHHFTKGGEEIQSLEAKNNDAVNIKGYYPWIEGATATAVPFDLSYTNPEQWIDLLYLSTPAPDVNTEITDSNNSINLTFSHAFCWVTIKLTKLSDQPDVKVKAVTIGNAYAGQKTVFNQGKLNLVTNEIVDGVSGPLKILQTEGNEIILNTQPETPVNAQPAEFNFLVPPVMRADMKDSEIVIEVTTLETSGSSGPEEEKVLTFPLSLSHLNKDGANYGFQKGKHNTYNIVYNNSSMNLSLSDWHSVEIEKATLGEGIGLKYSKIRNFGVYGNNDDLLNLGLSGTSLTKYTLQEGNHLYHSFLGEVAENNNGIYIDSISSIPSVKVEDRWKDAVRQEKVYPSIQVSGYNAAGGAQIPWKDKETGSLLAKQACVEYREGGYTDWRLPRISECYMMTYPDNFNAGSRDFWSATEANTDECYAATFDGRFYAQKYPKESSFYVRCVRDADKK